MIWKLILSIVDIINVFVIFTFWSQTSAEFISEGFAAEVIAYGRLFGLFAGYCFLKQLLYIGRVKWIEKFVGFDWLTRAHRLNGALAFLLVLFHSLFLSFGYSAYRKVSLFAQVNDFITNWDDVAGAYIAMIILSLVVLVTIFRQKLNYEIWYKSHLLIYFAFLLSFGHQVESGSDLKADYQFLTYWAFLYVFVIANFLLYRVVMPLRKFLFHRFVVEKIERETEDVVSIYISGTKLDKFKFQAGQFVIVRFLVKGLWLEAHPFSLSLPYNGEHLRITVKALGDFTERLKDLNVGTSVMIDGPHGVFTDRQSSSSKAALIAGGIGITPLRAIAESLLKANKEVTLIYSHRYEKDGVFLAELDNLIQIRGLKVFHLISRGEANIGEIGRISRDRIKRYVPDIAKYDVYICGPHAMMNDTKKLLRSLNVPRRAIKQERFAF